MYRTSRTTGGGLKTTAAAVAALSIGAATLGCPDTNGDDTVDVQDLTAVILDWGSDGSPNNSDVNGDGIVDVSDLTEVILNWGEFVCPSEGCEVGPGAPANDCCSTATIVKGSFASVPFDTTMANTDGPQDPDEDCNSANDGLYKDVWFSWTAPEDGLLTVGNCNAGTYDSKMFVYAVPEGVDACDGKTLIANTVACNDDCPDDSGIFTSEVEAFVSAGVQYLVRMGGYSPGGEAEAESGTGTITFDLLSDNDTCVVAETLLPGDVVTDTTADATLDETAISCGGGVPTAPGRWYKMVGDGSTFTVALCQTGFDFNTRLSIFCGSCDALECAVTELPDNCGGNGLFNEVLSICTFPDATYYVLVHGQDAAVGDYTIELTSDDTPCADPACPPAEGACCVDFACVGVTVLEDCQAQAGSWIEGEDCGTFDCSTLPANDECANAIDLGTGDVSADYDNTFATAGPDGAPEVSCNKFGDTPGCRKDLWYTYTVATDSTIQIDTCAGALDTKLVVYSGTDCPGDFEDIACNDDDGNGDDPPYCGGGTFSAVQVPAAAGTQLLIRVGSWGTDDNEGPSGASTLTVTVVGGVSSCCIPNGTPGCDDVECETQVCNADAFCCDVEWDQICADMAADVCLICGGSGLSNCCAANGTPGCDDPECEAAVCAADSFCCETEWDGLCADMAANTFCIELCTP